MLNVNSSCEKYVQHLAFQLCCIKLQGYLGIRSDNLSKPIEADMIGTPDPISNLRPVKYYIPPNESKEVSYLFSLQTIQTNTSI